MNKVDSSQTLINWVQSIAILIGGCWIFGYNFIYKDIYIPSKSPIHVTPTLKLRVDQPINGFIPITAYMEIENESQRDAHILPAVFLAIGSHLKKAENDAKQSEYLKYITKLANQDDDKFEGRYLLTESSQVVAGGGVFSGFVLSPNENTSKNYVFYVPVNKFDVLDVTLQFWAHNGNKKLWSKIAIPDNDVFENHPCEIIQESPWECKPILTLDNAQKEFGLWDFESKSQAPLPKAISK